MPDPEDLHLDRGLVVPASALAFRFDRSGGPGGQNVNKTATQATLTVAFDDLAPHLPPDALARLRALPSPAILEDRVVIQSSSSRSQWQNRRDAARKLKALLNLALKRRPSRIPTRVPRSVERKRLNDKRHRSDVKRARREPPNDSS
ncbi:MAG: alternative ribosome rescue aminoacyl-tRNA hydrolase ArfB [Planctomycetota bacterium]